MRNKLNKVKQNRILFSVMLLLSSIFYAYPNDDRNFQIRFSKGETDEITGGNAIALSFALDLPACTAFEAELLLPDSVLDGSYAEFDITGNGVDLRPSFNRVGVPDASRPGYKKYKITFEPNGNAANGASTGFTIKNFRSHEGDECEWESIQTVLYIGIVPNECSNSQDIVYSPCNLTINPPIVRASVGTNIYENNCSSTDPYKITVQAWINQGTYEVKLRSLNLKKPSHLECIGVTRSSSYNMYNIENISSNDIVLENETVKINNIIPWGYYSFYFGKTSQDNEGFNIETSLSYQEGEACNDNIDNQPILIGGNTQLNRPASCVPDSVNAPYLNKAVNGITACNNRPNTSNSTIFTTEVDAAFNGSKNQINNSLPLYYELELNSQDIGFFHMMPLNNNYNSTISYCYMKFGQNEYGGYNFMTKNNSIVFDADENIKKIRIKFDNISDPYFSQAFQFGWFTKTIPEKNTVYLCKTKLFQEENKPLKESNLALNVFLPSGNMGSTSPVPIENYIHNGANEALEELAMKYDTVYSACLKIKTTYLSNNFTYYTSRLLEFTEETPIKYYYGDKSLINNISDSEWKELGEDYYSINNTNNNTFISLNNLHEAILSNILVDNDPCSTGNEKYLYLKYDIKLKDNAPATNGNYINLFERISNVSSYYLSSSKFYVPSNIAFNSYMYASCDETQFTSRVTLAGNDNYVYNYVVDNFGNQDVDKQVVIAGSFPHTGDKNIISSTVRDSEFNMPISSNTINSIKISFLDRNTNEETEIYNGNLSGLSAAGWTMQYSASLNPCLNELDLNSENCSQVWTTSIPTENPAYYFMLMSPSEEFKLNKFTKLVVTVNGKLPADVVLGQKGSASFAAKIKLKNGDNYYAKENERLATIAIAETKNCTPGVGIIISDPCRTYSIRYVIPEVLAGDNAKLEWSTPNDSIRRLIPVCNLSYGDQCTEYLNAAEDTCGLKNNLPAQIDICSGENSVKLDATVKNRNVAYKWSTGETTSSIEAKKTGIYMVTITHKDRQCPPLTQSVTVGSADETCLSSSGSDATMNVCAGGAVRLNAPECGATYRWSPADYLSNPNIANPMASPPSTTAYNVAITTAGGCKINKTVYVNVNPPFELETGDDGKGILGCKDSKVALDVSGADGYRWYPRDGLSCYDCANPEHTVSGNKTYTVTGIKNGCLASKTMNIIQYPDKISFDYEILSDCKVRFKATDDETFDNYIWTFGDGKTGTGIETTHDYRASGHGTYNVGVEVTNACGIKVSHNMPITITTDDCPCQLQDCQ